MRVESRGEWERVRARGHGHWILWQGAIGFGVPLVLLILGFGYLTGDFPPSGDGISWWAIVLYMTFVSVAGGHVLAEREWHRAEERFG